METSNGKISFSMTSLYGLPLLFVENLYEYKTYMYKGTEIRYTIRDCHLVVQGSVFAWNWDSSFKEAVCSLQTFIKKQA